MTGKNATWPGSGCSTEMPSNRYSFVRGRPPLMRGSCELGGRATPGASDASVMNVRPFNGSCTTCSCSTTVPEAGGFRAQHRRVRRDRHLFAHVADGEVEVDPRLLAGRQPDARLAGPA